MKAKAKLITSVVFATISLFQIVGLIRYLERMPDDSLGIGLHVATIILFAAVAVLYYAKWSRERTKQ